MTNVQALKTLYVALGGDLDTVANLVENADVINAIATLVSGGTMLPAVDSTANGKIMKVVDGEWALAADAIE